METEMLHHANAVTIDALEQEQRRLARAIHDGPAQLLTNLALHSEIIERLIGMDTERAIAEVREMRREALRGADEMRHMINQFVPPGLLQRDLTEVLREHADRLRQRYGLDVVIDASEGLSLTESDQVTTFRVIQEALQNVLRHGHTRRAWIRLATEGQVTIVEVADQGTGFDPNDPAILRGGHLGIAGMRERADLAGGILRVESGPGTGTRIELRLPR